MVLEANSFASMNGDESLINYTKYKENISILPRQEKNIFESPFD